MVELTLVSGAWSSGQVEGQAGQNVQNIDQTRHGPFEP